MKRLGLGIATLFVVSAIIFSSISMLPGDFSEAVLGQAATKETVAAFRKELGLDKPAPVRYFQWVGSVLQGDLGTARIAPVRSAIWSCHGSGTRCFWPASRR